MHLAPCQGNPEKPLVSVLIFNYNYGAYLRQCFDSVFAQTYSNIEICFSDNASTDASWAIALEYAKKYPGTMTLACNRRNFGSDANFANCLLNARGKYFIELCSDDALKPEYVEKCVDALEANPNAGYAMVHRTIMDENGNQTEEPPFYNRSCVIPGREQAAVYMMAAVNPCISQVMYNNVKTTNRRAEGTLVSRWYGTRILDFNMCCAYDMIYIKEPLLLHRLHSQNDSAHAADNLLEVICPYVLQHQYADIASRYEHMEKAAKRLPEALDKLGTLSLRYSVRALIAGNEKCALRYYHLAAAISPELEEDETFGKLKAYWEKDADGKSEIIKGFKTTENLASRNVSYDPPPGSVSL